jgi:arginine deiminase
VVSIETSTFVVQEGAAISGATEQAVEGGVVVTVASGVVVEVDDMLMAVEEVLEADELVICCVISSRKNPE